MIMVRKFWIWVEAGAANNKGLLGGALPQREELTFNIELNIKYSLVLVSPTRMQQNVFGTYNALVGSMFSAQVVLYWTPDDSVRDLSSWLGLEGVKASGGYSQRPLHT